MAGTIENVSWAGTDKVSRWTVGNASCLIFGANMAVDADGAPNAYHPDDTPGLDFLANAGHPGNWWGVVTDNGKTSGTPVIQPSGPFKGFYVSQTSLVDGSKNERDPARYVDAATIPYIALPPSLLGGGVMARPGDVVLVRNQQTKQSSAAIVAETGPSDEVGEGSLALSAALGFGTDLRGHHAGTDDRIITYVVFLKSAAQPRWPRTKAAIASDVATRFAAIGGDAAANAAFPALWPV